MRKGNRAVQRSNLQSKKRLALNGVITIPLLNLKSEALSSVCVCALDVVQFYRFLAVGQAVQC